jgi:hypothetical protein
MTVPILAPYNTIFLTQGSARTLSMVVTDPDGGVANLTGATVIFTVKEKATDTAVVFRKISTDATQVLITNARAGLVSIFIEAADTKYRNPQEYVFDIWVVEPSGRPYSVIPPSPFVVQPGVTFLP